MRVLSTFALVCVVGLSGCGRATQGMTGDGHRGRYGGVGLYPAGPMWAQAVRTAAPQDSRAARTSDDDQVIVVIDSNTGELRQCGNLSGYCVGMNPWSSPLGTSQQAPVPLAKHAEALSQAPDKSVAGAATKP